MALDSGSLPKMLSELDSGVWLVVANEAGASGCSIQAAVRTFLLAGEATVLHRYSRNGRARMPKPRRGAARLPVRSEAPPGPCVLYSPPQAGSRSLSIDITPTHQKMSICMERLAQRTYA